MAEADGLYYGELDETKKTKLNELLEEVVSKVSIDYSNQEIQDIQTAVRTTLQNVVTRINERGIFTISRIQPYGSMTEQTAVWKHDKWAGEIYIEFDFLAVLGGSPATMHDHDCGGCARVSYWPVCEKEISRTEDISDRKVCADFFNRELNTCLVPCIVEMSTGALRVNGGRRLTFDCSFMLLWTSKAKNLFAHDKLLQEKAHPINTLSIHVDFLPALELFKPKPGGDEYVHDCFIVPKRCGVCDRHSYKTEQWRKSSCMAEIAHVVNEMSEKHRKCYQLVKYFASFIDKGSHPIRWYHVKTITLNHSRECSGSSDSVLKLLVELRHAYRTRTLKSFH